MVSSTLTRAVMLSANDEIEDEEELSINLNLKAWSKGPSLKEMQDYVGGYIEVIQIDSNYIIDDIVRNFPSVDNIYALVVNEDGLMLKLKENTLARLLTGMHIVGNAMLFIGPIPDEDDDGEES